MAPRSVKRADGCRSRVFEHNRTAAPLRLWYDQAGLSMSLLGFCEWLANTSGSIALHESVYMYPLVESAHVLTLCVFLGTAIMVDLRLLGVVFVRVPMTEIRRRLGPWVAAGFIV